MKKLLSLGICLCVGLGWVPPAAGASSERSHENCPLPCGFNPCWRSRWRRSSIPENTFHFFMVPLGLNVPLGPRRDLVFELTPMLMDASCDSACSWKALSVSAGMSWTSRPGPSGGSGLFVQPKVMGLVAHGWNYVHIIENPDWKSAPMRTR